MIPEIFPRRRRRALAVLFALFGMIAPAGCQTTNFKPIAGDRIGIVLMHGKGGTTRAVDSLAADLAGAGILVETPLMPWSRDRIFDKGYDEAMAEIDGHVARLRAQGAKRIIVAGHSLGANASLGYAARRNGLAGIVLLAYGHVPGLSGFANRISDSVDKAQSMIHAGRGEEKAAFDDWNQGRRTSVYGSANDVLSWLDSESGATIDHNAPKVKRDTPVLCIDGTSDRWQRCDGILLRTPQNPKSKAVTVNAGHVGTPAESTLPIVTWVRTLDPVAPKNGK